MDTLVIRSESQALSNWKLNYDLDILIDKLVPTDIMQPKNKPPRQVAQVGIFQTQYQQGMNQNK